MKVCFLSWHFNTPEVFLNYIRHMTPGKSGKWKDMEAVTDIKQADFYIIFDGHNENIDESRAIYFCQHPKVVGYNQNVSKSFKDYSNKQCLKYFNSDNGLNPGEWWLDYDYDFLSALKAPDKKKTLACIMTYQTHNPMYEQRVKFMQAFSHLAPQTGAYLDIYGRPEERFNSDPYFKWLYRGSLGYNTPDGTKGEHTHGKNLLIDYRYSLEFDVGPTQNYLSERFYDSLLLWCFPIYFGSNNVEKYFPRNSFEYVDILDLTSIEKTYKIVLSNRREENIKAIEEARDLILNKYQTWPRTYEIIKNL